MAVTLVFGAPTNALIGVVQSQSDNDSVEIVYAKDENGKVIESKAVSKTEEKQVEALIDSSIVTPPAAGTTLVFGEGASAWTGLVKSVNKTRPAGDFNKMSLTVEKKDNSNLVPYA